MITHPLTYRASQMKTLAQRVVIGESCSVVGLPGCGRSNLLDFLCHQPEALQRYLPAKSDPVALIPVDLKNLPANDLTTLYRVILRAFYWSRQQFEADIQATISELYMENRATSDPFLSQSALYELLFAFQATQTRIVLVLNRFDYFCLKTEVDVVNNLRGLRDSFKDTLCFIVGMRQAAAYLPDPDKFGDMYELLDSYVCWVGAMVDDDATNVVTRATTTALQPPSEEEVATILRLTGNFPVLLKAVGDWWLDNQQTPLTEWRTVLADRHNIEYRLERLWESLTQEEQFALAAVREWQTSMGDGKRKSNASKSLQKLHDEHGEAISLLFDKGVLEDGDRGLYIKGQLLMDYIGRIGPTGRGRIRLDKQTEEVYQGVTPLRNLPPLEDKLLRLLIKQPYKRHTYSSLIESIFSSDARNASGEKFIERTRQDLFPLIRSLRKKVEVNTAKPCYIINWTGNPEGGYQFFPEGRPE